MTQFMARGGPPSALRPPIPPGPDAVNRAAGRACPGGKQTRSNES